MIGICHYDTPSNSYLSHKQKLTTMATSTTSNLRPKGKWGLIVKIILTVASAIAGIFGISACAD